VQSVAQAFRPSKGTRAALRFEGTLGVAGLAGSVIDWKVDGVIQDPSVVAPVVRAWLERGARPGGN